MSSIPTCYILLHALRWLASVVGDIGGGGVFVAMSWLNDGEEAFYKVQGPCWGQRGGRH